MHKLENTCVTVGVGHRHGFRVDLDQLCIAAIIDNRRPLFVIKTILSLTTVGKTLPVGTNTIRLETILKTPAGDIVGSRATADSSQVILRVDFHSTRQQVSSRGGRGR